MFFPTVWGWIKKWFDPITTSKIFILSHSEVQNTLTSFIDPANIPKKYGGELDFQFGDMPVPDPAWEQAIEWEGDYKTFPNGPMYWIHGDDDKKMKALAVGSLDEHQRKEGVCVISDALEDGDRFMNGHATAGRESHQQHFDSSIMPPANISETVDAMEKEGPVVQNGEVVAASRPEPVTFVTATDGLDGMALNEKLGNISDGTVPALTEDSRKANGEANSDAHGERLDKFTENVKV
jgi:CRAL/TRIO domain